MTSEQFAYWLQGFVELNGGAMPTEAQWKSVQDHLQTVFVKVTQPVRTVGPNIASPALPDPMRGLRDLGDDIHRYMHGPKPVITC